MLNQIANPLTAGKSSASPLRIGLARSQDDLRQAFSLTYQSYFRAGLTGNNPSGLRLTPYHLLNTSEVVVAKLRDTVVSTVSFFGDGNLGLPMQNMYPREIEMLRGRGLRLAEIGSLADRRTDPGRFISTFAQMGRLVAQIAIKRSVDTLVIVAHPKHARLYKRVLGFKQVGDHKDCPYANGNPAEALYLRFDDLLGTRLHRQYFGEPYPASSLERFEWGAATRAYFGRILDADGKIAVAVGMESYYDWGVCRNKTPVDLSVG